MFGFFVLVNLIITFVSFFDIVRKFKSPGGVMVATKDLKSFGPKGPCRFESGPGYEA